eukprot:6755603-Prymnesium_polylepis.1
MAPKDKKGKEKDGDLRQQELLQARFAMARAIAAYPFALVVPLGPRGGGLTAVLAAGPIPPPVRRRRSCSPTRAHAARECADDRVHARVPRGGRGAGDLHLLLRACRRGEGVRALVRSRPPPRDRRGPRARGAGH